MLARFILAVVALAVAVPALGQQSTAVQLPTYSYFGTGTSVLVPDGGRAYMGGINRAASGRNEFGVPLMKNPLFQNRGIGMERSAMSTSVSVQIHDFEAMEEALLSQPSSPAMALTPRRPSAGGGGPGLETLRAGVPRSSPMPLQPRSPTLAEVRTEIAEEQQSRGDEAADFFRRGQEAEAAGKPGVAKIYYGMAARRAEGELKQEVLARLDALKGTSSARLAQGNP